MTARRALGCALLGALISTLLWLVGVDLAFVVAAAPVPFVIGVLLSSAWPDEGALWGPSSPGGTPGARKDVMRLAWSLQPQHRSADAVSDTAVARMRALAATRLMRRYGLDISEPADSEEIKDLIGERAFAIISPRSTMTRTRLHIDIALRALIQLEGKETQ